MSSVVISGDSSGTITLQAPAVSGSTTINLPATSGTATVMPTGYTLGAGNTSSFKNRIINGAMVIDQRNNGSAQTGITNTVAYICDRFYFQNASGATVTIQQSSTAPTGFAKSSYCTVTSSGSPAYGFIQHNIEGYNVADFAMGTANAKTFTLSFWVRSSLTGTYSACIQSSLYDYSYCGTYTINSANTWEYKTITIPGTASGTWYTDNRLGMVVRFALISNSGGTPNTWVSGSQNGSSNNVNWFASNGNTFYVTGVQLEVDSTATSFDYRDYGRELILCQRYYEKFGFVVNTTLYYNTGFYRVTKRTQPTLTVVPNSGSGAAVSGQVDTTNTLDSFYQSVANSTTTGAYVTVSAEL